MKKKLKVVLMSGSETGYRYIEVLKNLEYANLVLVVTGTDKPCGRGLNIARAPVARYCDTNRLKVFQPEKINSRDSITELRRTAADLAVVIDYGQILSQEVLDIFPSGSFNLHYSILPDLRGPEPVRWVLLKGYKETGVTLMKMDEKIDTGGIISIKTVNIEELDNYKSLKEKLTCHGIKLLSKFLLDLYNGNKIKLQPQKECADITHAKKLGKELCKMNWKLSAREIVNHIKALSPDPGCYTVYKKKNMRVKIIMARETELGGGIHGNVVDVTSEDFTISSKTGGVRVLKIQPSGKRIMEAKNFLTGNPVEIGDEFE